jgi:hypothetical protein
VNQWLGNVLPDGKKEVMPLSVGYANDGGERWTFPRGTQEDERHEKDVE